MKIKIMSLLAALALALGLSLAGPAAPALANGACTPVAVCFYQCPLSGTCGPNLTYMRYYPSSCTDLEFQDENIYVQSVKNHTYRTYAVYHTHNCTGTMSYFYPQTSGNMNAVWDGYGIGSIKWTGN